jgi:hypothetical protein
LHIAGTEHRSVLVLFLRNNQVKKEGNYMLSKGNKDIRFQVLGIYLIFLIFLTALIIFSVQPGVSAANNLALGRTVTVDSTYSSYAGTNAVDGVISDASRWLSANTNGPHWITIDLGASYTLGAAWIYTGFGDTGAVANWVLQSWNGSVWQDIAGTMVTGNTNVDLCQLFSSSVTTSRVRFYSTDNGYVRVKEIELYVSGQAPTPTPTPAPSGTPNVKVLVNQSGYELNKPKRLTAPLASNGTPFYIKKVGNANILFSGTITNNVGDFSGFNPSDPGEYVIETGGETSVPFSIGPYWIQKVSIKPALDFMIGSRAYVGITTGHTNTEMWRDGCQYAFEIPSLLNQYWANPSVYERMPVTVSYVSGYGDLDPPAANSPDLIKLVHWGLDRILKTSLNHTLLKGQLAYFLYSYPEIKQYITQNTYNTVRDYAFNIWRNDDRSRYSWGGYEVDHTGNLLQVYTQIGSGKGTFPPGHSIIPNLLMYEVAKREGRADYMDYFNAAYNQTAWIINNLDWNDPTTTKGQRMSERITMEALAYFQKNYAGQAPPGLLAKIDSWADIMIARSNNLWDFRKYDDPADGSGTGDLWIIPSFNEPGNVAGFPAAALAACQVLTDPVKANRLRQISYAQVDNVFGRNPFGRHFSHDAPRDFEGVESGWFTEYQGGAGELNNVLGVLDASPKEASYPYNPSADYGYTEGWVNFNTAWNEALAYLAAEDTEVKVFDPGFAAEINTVSPGQTIGIQLKAPLNFNYNSVESGHIIVLSSNGDSEKLAVNEVTANHLNFRATAVVSTAAANSGDGVIQAPANGWFAISYGYGFFKKEVIFTGNGSSFVKGGATPTPAPTVTPTPTPTPTPAATPTPIPTATSTPTPGGVLFSDNFEDGDAIGWTVVNGAWSVVTDGAKVYKQTSTTGEALIYAGSTLWTNYTVEAKMKLYTTGTAATGIIGRYTDGNNYYLLRLHIGYGKVELYKKSGGTFTLLQDAALTITTNTWYSLKLVLNGGNLTGYVDGVQKVSATDNSITAGCIGVRAYVQSCAVDDFSVTQ